MRDLSLAKDPPAAWQCPFCLSYKDTDWPMAGTELIILNGSHAGYRCIVPDNSIDKRVSDRFFVRMEFETRENALCSLMPGHDQYLDMTRYRVPPWMAELAIEDNATLHLQLVQNMRALFLANDKHALCDGLRGIIQVCWWRRFPLTGIEIWRVLEAHGVQPHLERDAIELFDFGVDILRYAQGRAANKRRRMPPMSQGRYLTKSQRETNISLFGRV